jgi:hypothetical protein
MSTSDVSYEYSPLRSSPSGYSGDEFRLLVLLPGRDDDEIRCEIRHASLDGPPQYEALSYTWGDPKGEESLVPCRGDPNASYTIKVDSGHLLVKYNLNCALKQLRHDTNPRTLWIDAICINQGNGEEKNHQVKAMVRIYSGASRILAWLGEDDEYTDLAFDSIEEFFWAIKVIIFRYCSKQLELPIFSVDEFHVASVIEMKKNGALWWIHPSLTGDIIKAFHMLPSINFEATPDIEAAALTDFGDLRPFARYLISETEGLLDDARFSERIVAVREVFNYRTYWKRLWIVQELVSAAETTLICGRRSVDLGLFKIMDLVLRNGLVGVHAETGRSLLLPALDPESIESFLGATLEAIAFNFRWSQGRVSLAENIEDCSYMLCSEPRDYIYALLNISTPIQIPIDYQLSTNVIYTQATRQIIQQDSSIDIIFKRPQPHQPDRSRQSDIDTPSWVPRYDADLSDGNLTRIWLRYNAGGLILDNRLMDQSATWDNDLVLQLNGYYGSKIAHASPFLTDEVSREEFWETVLALNSQFIQNSGTKVGRIWQKIRPHLRKIKKGADRAKEKNFPFWNTLVMDLYESPSKPYYYKRMDGNKELHEQFMQYIETALSSNSAPPKRLLQLLCYSLRGKKLCLLANGQLALVHGDTEPGDVLFIARGASAPLIIRPTDPSFRLGKRRADDPDPEFTFVGGAYLYGVMDGEVVQKMDRMNFKDESIRLV